MNLVNWEPFRDMESFLNRFYDWPGRNMRVRGDDTAKAFEWRPSVDISESKKQYVIKAELPEVDKNDVDVSVENGMLSITGERRFESEDETEEQHRIERMYGRFSRSFTLPADADADRISAKSKNGVLKVVIPKIQETPQSAIKISVE